jgi:hypothetical protein
MMAITDMLPLKFGAEMMAEIDPGCPAFRFHTLVLLVMAFDGEMDFRSGLE